METEELKLNIQYRGEELQEIYSIYVYNNRSAGVIIECDYRDEYEFRFFLYSYGTEQRMVDLTLLSDEEYFQYCVSEEPLETYQGTLSFDYIRKVQESLKKEYFIILKHIKEKKIYSKSYIKVEY